MNNSPKESFIPSLIMLLLGSLIFYLKDNRHISYDKFLIFFIAFNIIYILICYIRYNKFDFKPTYSDIVIFTLFNFVSIESLIT